jgi:DNA-binding MarR family transcriptional regulator
MYTYNVYTYYITLSDKMKDLDINNTSNLVHTGPEDNIGILLCRTSNAWQRQVKKTLKKQGLTQAQYVLLLGLRKLEERNVIEKKTVTQRSLAIHSGVDQTMTSQVLRQLEQAYLIRRAPGSDARSHALFLTDSGRRTISDIEPEITDLDSQFFSVLGENTQMFKATLQILIGLTPRMSSRGNM